MSTVLLTSVLPTAAAAAAPPTPPPAAEGVPETLAHSVPADGRVVDPSFPIDFVAVTWQGEHAAASVRFRFGRAWSPWQPLPEDGIEVPGEFASGLVAAGDADAYQVRLPAGVRAARSVALNTTDGERVAAPAPAPGFSAAAASPGGVVPRSVWGADERLRTWGPRFFTPQKFTVHHTAGRNDDPDPAATVRAIYRFHAVDRGWGDIGYQFLVDGRGRVYEGRYSDADPATPAGFDARGRVVEGAHVAGYNSGNVGISLLGTYDARRPSVFAQRSLERLLADLSARTGIAPAAWSTYRNPSGGATWTGPNVLGHRHLGSTSCPGGVTYALLPTLRERIAQRLAGTLVADSRMVRPTSVVATTGVGRARVRWRTAGDPSDTQLRYWPQGRPARAVSTKLDLRFVEQHDVLVTGLARGTYEYQMIDADRAGNRYVAPVRTFRVR